MRDFVNKSQIGAINSYSVGLLAIILLLVGGVFLLKNHNFGSSEIANVSNVSQNENARNLKKDKESENNANKTPTKEDGNLSKNRDNSDEQTSAVSDSTANSLATTGASSEYSPENLAETGPADTIAAIFGVAVAMCAGYASWQYYLSQQLVKRKLLEK